MPKWLKMVVKKYPDELKSLYDKYARGAPQKYKKIRGGKWKWSNNIYDTKGEMMDAIKKFGTYKDYKGGTTALRMIKAKRKRQRSIRSMDYLNSERYGASWR